MPAHAKAGFIVEIAGSSGSPIAGPSLDDHPTHADLLIGPAMSLRRQPREIHLLTRSPADPDHVFQLWPPLAAGHTLALPPDVLLAEDRDMLSAWLREHASGRPRRPPRPVMASR